MCCCVLTCFCRFSGNVGETVEAAEERSDLRTAVLHLYLLTTTSHMFSLIRCAMHSCIIVCTPLQSATTWLHNQPGCHRHTGQIFRWELNHLPKEYFDSARNTRVSFKTALPDSPTQWLVKIRISDSMNYIFCLISVHFWLLPEKFSSCTKITLPKSWTELQPSNHAELYDCAGKNVLFRPLERFVLSTCPSLRFGQEELEETNFIQTSRCLEVTIQKHSKGGRYSFQLFYSIHNVVYCAVVHA